MKTLLKLLTLALTINLFVSCAGGPVVTGNYEVDLQTFSELYTEDPEAAMEFYEDCIYYYGEYSGVGKQFEAAAAYAYGKYNNLF